MLPPIDADAQQPCCFLFGVAAVVIAGNALPASVSLLQVVQEPLWTAVSMAALAYAILRKLPLGTTLLLIL